MKTFFFFFFRRAQALVSLALASSISVLGLESVCPRKGCPYPWPRIFFVSLALASSLVSSTPPLISRGVIEDSRLEAKINAKETKKYRGQGQGQTLSRPWTKERTQSQVFSKKKGLQKFFSGEKDLQNFFSGNLYLRKRKKGLCRFSARFLVFFNEISTVQK